MKIWLNNIIHFMKKYDPVIYVYILVMWVGLTVAYQVNEFRVELRDFKGKIVFDIDKVRKSLLDEMNYMYFEGCRKGIDYPEEYRLESNVFNEHSPSIYCRDEQQKLNDYIYNKVKEIGRE